MENNKNNKLSNSSKDIGSEEEKTVRGSGFTYDESKDNTDKSLPITQAEQDEIVELPKLGEPDRK